MRALGMVALLGLVACAGPRTAHDRGDVAPAGVDPTPVAAQMQPGAPDALAGGPFSGAWESCEGASSPEECSRYLLVQRGERICGTWSYLASGQAYDGRLVSRATSSTQARRTHVCGRPGAETDTECSDGWQRIDKPLLLCDGKLGDMVGAGGECFADYQAAHASQGEWDRLLAAPWVQECLSSPL